MNPSTVAPPVWQALIDLASRGGPVVWVLCGLSVLALTIVLLKLFQFAQARIWSRAWVEAVVADVEHGDTERALGRAESHRSATARVVAVALRGLADRHASESAVREEVERVGQLEVGRLESNLRGLDTVGTLAPLLGLLGTVLGMIRAFMQIESSGARADAALLSGGIWEALLTTAVGLAVAIPTLAALSWLESQVDRTRRHMGDTVTRVLTATARADAADRERRGSVRPTPLTRGGPRAV